MYPIRNSRYSMLYETANDSTKTEASQQQSVQQQPTQQKKEDETEQLTNDLIKSVKTTAEGIRHVVGQLSKNPKTPEKIKNDLNDYSKYLHSENGLYTIVLKLTPESFQKDPLILIQTLKENMEKFCIIMKTIDEMDGGNQLMKDVFREGNSALQKALEYKRTLELLDKLNKQLFSFIQRLFGFFKRLWRRLRGQANSENVDYEFTTADVMLCETYVPELFNEGWFDIFGVSANAAEAAQAATSVTGTIANNAVQAGSGFLSNLFNMFRSAKGVDQAVVSSGEAVSGLGKAVGTLLDPAKSGVPSGSDFLKFFTDPSVMQCTVGLAGCYGLYRLYRAIRNKYGRWRSEGRMGRLQNRERMREKYAAAAKDRVADRAANYAGMTRAAYDQERQQGMGGGMYS